MYYYCSLLLQSPFLIRLIYVSYRSYIWNTENEPPAQTPVQLAFNKLQQTLSTKKHTTLFTKSERYPTSIPFIASASAGKY